VPSRENPAFGSDFYDLRYQANAYLGMILNKVDQFDGIGVKALIGVGAAT